MTNMAEHITFKNRERDQGTHLIKAVPIQNMIKRSDYYFVCLDS